MNDDEIYFFEQLLLKSKKLPGAFKLDRLSSKTFNVFYESTYLGKVHLWKEPVSFAVIRNGAKRATKVFTTREEATVYSGSRTNKYTIETREPTNDKYIQYIVGLSDAKTIFCKDVEKCVSLIPKWLSYIKYCKKDMLIDVKKTLFK
jgi:hypothetical protein